MYKIHHPGNNLRLRVFLKVSNDVEFLIVMGREFHICGAAMGKCLI